uniref:Pyruvate kinase n=1 Tax=Phaeocystis antarctica TaxID=33657 RepID=A0A7S0ENP3_9EUKA
MLVALGLPLGFVATAPSGSSSACARYRSVLDVVVHMNMEATRDGDPTMSASRLTGGTSKFAAQHTNTVLDMGLMVDPIARNCLDRNAKIVSTLGPASFSQEMIEKLVAAGVDIFRLNSSHRRPGQFEELIPWIREAGRKAGRKVEILGDIQGPKFRCSMTEGDQPVPLEGGSTVQLGLCVDDNDLTRPGRVALTPTIEQTALVKGVQPGMTLLFDDGLMEVKMLSRISETEVTCAVIEGGTLKSRKGINVPELQIDCSALTIKDREDAEYLLDVNVHGGVDYIALSFAQCAQDIQDLIDIMDKVGTPLAERPLIIPKIEKPAALRNIDEILALSDGLMVARGDLGVELGLHRVPVAQKFLIRKANVANKFCICATQMMESMITNPVPTRAEVSDVAGAVFDGTDAVMTSGETAMGAYPEKVVQAMGLIIAESEAHAGEVNPSV